MKASMWILVIVIVLLAGTGIYLLTQGKNMTPSPSQLPNPNSNPTSSPSSTPTPTPTPTSTYSDLMGNIANNHGHTVVITAAQQEASQAVTLLLTVGSGHTHTLSLTAAQVQDIANGKTVSATSSVNAGHNHLVTFN